MKCVRRLTFEEVKMIKLKNRKNDFFRCQNSEHEKVPFAYTQTKRSHQARQISLTSSKKESKLAENESFHFCLTLAHSLGNSPISLFRE